MEGEKMYLGRSFCNSLFKETQTPNWAVEVLRVLTGGEREREKERNKEAAVCWDKQTEGQKVEELLGLWKFVHGSSDTPADPAYLAKYLWCVDRTFERKR